MKKVLLFLLICGVANAATYTVSNKEINSISCPDGILITDIFMSEKARIKTEIRKDKVFFEYLEDRVEQDGRVIIFREEESTTLSLFCGDEEYSLTLAPKGVAGARVVLPTRKQVMQELTGLPRETQLRKVITDILSDNTKGYKSSAGGQVAKIDKAEYHLRKVYIAGRYRAKEVYIYSPGAVSEADIFKLTFISAPVAMTMPTEDIRGWQRVIVVEEVQ
jgi:hypothetical protein